MLKRPLVSGAAFVAVAVAAALAAPVPASPQGRTAGTAGFTVTPDGGCTPLAAVVATPSGSTTVCETMGCTAGTVTESHTGGGAVTHQWGIRTSPGAHIADIPEATGASYLIRGTDFPGPGTYYLVVRTTQECGLPIVSNEVAITVTAVLPSDTVRYLTVTSKDEKNVLQWLNPPGFGKVTIRYNWGPSTCAFPSMPLGGDGSLLAGSVVGAPGQPATLRHDTPALTNGFKYCYTVWVDKGGSVFSAGRSNSGRPFSTAGLVKWSFNLGIFSMVSPGNGAGVVHMVANDNSLHSVMKGEGPKGGEWPTAPEPWIPQSMNGPSQGRPSGINVSMGTAQPAIVLSSQDGHVYVFDAETGAPGWSPSSPLLGPTVLAHPSGVLTVFGGSRDLIFVGTRDSLLGGRFYALRLADGGFASPGWVFDGGAFGKIGPIHGQAAVDQEGKRVYFASRAFDGSNPNTIWCVNLETGAGVWAAAVGDVDTAVTFVGDRLYVGTNTGEVKAIETSEGHVAWSFPIFPALEGNVKGYVAVNRISGDVFFSTANRLWGLKSDGTAKWIPADRALASPSTPVFAPLDAWIYVGGGDEQFHRFSVATGAEDMIAPFPVSLVDSGGVGSPTFDLPAGFVYVGSEGGLVYAIRLP